MARKDKQENFFIREIKKGYNFAKKKVESVLDVFKNKPKEITQSSKKEEHKSLDSVAKESTNTKNKTVKSNDPNSTTKNTSYRDFIQDQYNQGNVMPMGTVAETIINEFRRSLSPYAGLILGKPAPNYDLFNAWLDKLIDDFGVYDVARMLEDGINAGVLVTRDIMYNDDSFNNYITQMMDYLPDAGILTKEAIGEYLEGMDYNY